MTARYPKNYGAWAGNPHGMKPDFARCCVEVFRWSRASQCQRKRGYGPDKAYCKQHDPAAVQARKDAATSRWNVRFNSNRYQYHGRTFFDALTKIAAGHNDPCALAREVIADFEKGLAR